MTTEDLENIIQKYLKGKLSEVELDLLLDSLSEEWARRQLQESIEINYLLSLKYQKVDSKAAYQDFLSKIQPPKKVSLLRTKKFSILKYAAVFVVLFGLGYQFLFRNEAPLSTLEIKNKAITLQLSSGEVDVVDEDDNTQIWENEGQTIATRKGSKITYADNAVSEKLVYNELNIPYGKKFQVQLSDGTIVYLNSGSSLKYPVNFLKGQHREVFLTGEAYFKVAEDMTHPFVVNAQEVNIKVLGTEFNVSSYDEDESINTVLVSGSVQLYRDSNLYDSEDPLELVPEQKGSWDKADMTFEVQKVNTDVHTAWISGRLIFRDMTFKTIRKKLERHYNVTIINSNKQLEENTFNAVFDIESIEEVLEVFDRNFDIKYRIQNNQIIIFKNQNE